MRRLSDVPLASDGSTWFLAWLDGLMVFLAALALVAAILIGNGVTRWHAGLAGTLTVQIPAPVEGGAVSDEKLQEILQLLRLTPGIISAKPIEAVTAAGMLKPWLGDMDTAGLPIPTLIDVHTSADTTIDIAALTHGLDDIVPDATIATQDRWLGRMFGAARIIVFLSYAILGLIAGTASLTVIFATRTGLLIHREVIELLHLIGASDFYIARQFQFHAFKLGIGGGIGGLIAAAIFFAGLAYSGWVRTAGDADIFAELTLPDFAWIALAVLPLITGGIGLIVARLTVLRELGRRP